MKKSGLGRGLDALLPQEDTFLETVVRELPMQDIDPDAGQPRRDFDASSLEQLADSIRAAGVLQPILVVPMGSRYRIVAGERRFRAARIAGLQTLPCIVRDMTSVERMEAALIENLQREDLNPMDEASAVRALMDECGYTQEDAANRLGKSRPAVANLLRLLALPEEVRQMVRDGTLSSGHARALVGVTGEARQTALAKRCAAEEMSVRALEELIKREDRKPRAAALKPALPAELSALEDTFRQTFGVRAALSGTEKAGKITLTYKTPQELEHIYELLHSLDAR